MKHFKETCKPINVNNTKKLIPTIQINHSSTYSKMKTTTAECVIRILKEKFFKYFSFNRTYNWIDRLPEIVKQYNNRWLDVNDNRAGTQHITRTSTSLKKAFQKHQLINIYKSMSTVS